MFPLKDNIPTERTPYVTISLIVLNVLVYFLWQRGGIAFSEPSSQHYLEHLIDYGAFPYEITHPGDHCAIVQTMAGLVLGCDPVAFDDQAPTIITPFTSMFMHGGLLHLGGNMLFLWIFGNNVEDAMGHAKFIVFYLLGGLAAMALQVAIDPDAVVPTIGASGAVAAVLGGYILLHPRARIITVIFIIFFFTILELPAFVILGFWFLQQIAFGALDLADPTGQGGGVAYFAHIGGFLFGLLAIKLFASRDKDYSPPPRYPVY
ncbi:MAG: rhomboid family intramembrane serine protease [Solirubrobacteraceae bacterium]